MPKKPSHRSIVREIRQALGWTQLTLAKRLGLSLSALNRIENGTLKISRRLALRLSWTTGVFYQDILANKPGAPQTRRGPLSSSTLQQMDKQARSLSEEELKAIVDNIAYDVELLVRAAFEYAPAKLWSLDAAIVAELMELEREFGLSANVKKIRQSVVWADPEAPAKMKKAIEEVGKLQRNPAIIKALEKAHKAGAIKTEVVSARMKEPQPL